MQKKILQLFCFFVEGNLFAYHSQIDKIKTVEVPHKS